MIATHWLIQVGLLFSWINQTNLTNQEEQVFSGLEKKCGAKTILLSQTSMF
jgi:hypothetical protein